MSLPILTTPEAEAYVRTIDAWWRANRLAAPDLFLEELAASFDLIANAPRIGRAYRRTRVPGVRRVLLRATRYHVYYVPRTNDVLVLAVWHAMRGSGPALGRAGV